MNDVSLITMVVFLPILGAVLLLFIGGEKKVVLKGFTFVVTLVTFFVSIFLYTGFDPAEPGMQFVEKAPWIPAYGISYHVGVDGISLFLILLTTFLSVISVLACWKDIQERVKEFMICLLFLEEKNLDIPEVLQKDHFSFNMFLIILVLSG